MIILWLFPEFILHRIWLVLRKPTHIAIITHIHIRWTKGSVFEPTITGFWIQCLKPKDCESTVTSDIGNIVCYLPHEHVHVTCLSIQSFYLCVTCLTQYGQRRRLETLHQRPRWGNHCCNSEQSKGTYNWSYILPISQSRSKSKFLAIQLYSSLFNTSCSASFIQQSSCSTCVTLCLWGTYSRGLCYRTYSQLGNTVRTIENFIDAKN